MTTPLFLRVCRREPVERPPVWLMRQAGRYLPEYRAVRERAGDFLTLCRTPELAAEVTLQPIRRFGLDAAIIFSDILIPAQAMGAHVTFAEGEGPRIANPVRSRADAQALREPEPREACAFLYETLRTVRRELPAEVPLIGFAAAPYTLASYLIEGETSRGFETSRAFLLGDPAGARELLSKVARVTARYLAAQVEAGAQALQLFDTWAGLLSPRDYRALALESVLELRTLLDAKVPLIYFLNGVSSVLEDLPFDILSIDWRTDIAGARRRTKAVLQGNVDPAVLLAGPEATRARTREVLEATGGRDHIVNLGHGILPKTPIASVEAMVETVKAWKT